MADASRPVTTTQDEVTQPPAFYMGVVFELNGREVSLEPLTPINYIDKTGLECRLDEPVELGEIGENLATILETVGADSSTIFKVKDPEPPDGEDKFERNAQGKLIVKDSIKDIPVVGEIVETLLEADVTIEQFYVKIPPKGATTPVRYTIGMSAVWDVAAGEGRLFGEVYLKGLYLKVSNEDVLLLAAENQSTATTPESN
jgi:hypothetical protein